MSETQAMSLAQVGQLTDSPAQLAAGLAPTRGQLSAHPRLRKAMNTAGHPVRVTALRRL